MEELTPKEAQGRLDAGALLVDVREPNEWEEIHARGATPLPLSELEARYGELPRDKPLVMICRSGARSARAAEYLMGQGYSNVANLKGGTLAWVEDGFPTEQGA